MQQHTLPKFYLKGFLANGSGGRLNVFHLESLRWSKVAPKRLSAREDYYEDPASNIPEGLYEYFLHRTEDVAARTIKLISNGAQTLDEANRDSLAQFVCTLALRVPSYHEFFADWYSANGLEFMAKAIRSEPEKYRQLARNFIAEYRREHGDLPVPEEHIFNFDPLKSGLRIAVESARRLALMSLEQEIAWLKRFDWTVLETEPSQPFITTDSPVVRHVSGTGHYVTVGGYGLKDFQLSLPLSARLAFIAQAGNGHFRKVRASSEMVRAINVRTGSLAREYVITGTHVFPGSELCERNVQRSTQELRQAEKLDLPPFADEQTEPVIDRSV